MPIPRASRLYLHLSSATSLATMTFTDLIPLLQLPPEEAEVCALMSAHSTVSDRFLPCLASITLQDEMLIDVNSRDGESVVSRMTLHIHDLLRVSRKLPDAYGEEYPGNPLSGFRITLHSSERIVVLYATTKEVHREWMLWFDDRIASAAKPVPRSWSGRSESSGTASTVLEDPARDSVGQTPPTLPAGGTTASLKNTVVHRPVELYETSRAFPGHMLWSAGTELADMFPELSLPQLDMMRRMQKVEGPGTWSEIGQADPFVLDDRDNALFNGSQPWVKERFAPSQYLSNVAGLPTVKEELERLGKPRPTFAQHATSWISSTPWVEFVSTERAAKKHLRNEAKRLLLRRISALRLALEGLDERRLPYDEEEMVPIEKQVVRGYIPLPVDITPLEVPLFWEKQYDDTRAGIIRMRESLAQRLYRR